MNHANFPVAASHSLLKRRRERYLRKLFAGRSLLAAGFLGCAAALSPGDAGAAPYQDAVLSLNPTYYYQLNETSTGAGAIDSTGTATGPSSYNGDYVNGPPMVGGPGPLEVFGGIPVPGVGGETNKAHYSNNSGHVIVGPGTAYGANAITVALFLKAGPAEGGDRIFTNNLADPTKSFQIVTANDGLVVAVDPANTGLTAERTLFMEDNSGPDRRLIDSSAGWFHVVASTSGATGADRATNIRVWINGIDRTENLQPNVTGWGIDTAFAKIGGRKDDPTHTTTHSGAQDEVAIWLNRVLTDAEVASLWTAARRKIPTPYQGAVMDLSPTYYYHLDETATNGGAIDSTGHATGPSSYNGDYVNGPPMVGGPGPLEVFGGIKVPGVGGLANKAHYSNNAGHIILGPGVEYGANDMTIACFLKAGPAEGGDRIFTNNLADPTKSFQLVTANDGLVLAVDPGNTGLTAERTLFMEDNSGPDRRLIDAGAGWFHVVASTSGATGPDRANNFRIWINGVDRTENLQPNVTGWGIDTAFAKIGGRKDDPTHTTTHSGAQDEVAIWLNRVLTDAEVRSLWTAAGQPPLSIRSIVRAPGGASVTLTINSKAGRTYAVDYSTAMTAAGQPGGWVQLTASLASEGDQTTYVDTTASNLPRAYYRARDVTP